MLLSFEYDECPSVFHFCLNSMACFDSHCPVFDHVETATSNPLNFPQYIERFTLDVLKYEKAFNQSILRPAIALKKMGEVKGNGC